MHFPFFKLLGDVTNGVDEEQLELGETLSQSLI